MKFGSKEVTLERIDIKRGEYTEQFTSALSLSVVKVGLNYKF